MKRLVQLAIFFSAVSLLFGCEDVITTKLDTGPARLSVDGWLTNQPGPQTIRLTLSTAYFNNGTVPAASGATVSVTDDAGKQYAFTDPDNDGYYIWTPTTRDTLGKIGRTYQLAINYGGVAYSARTTMNRVPAIDSLVFRQEKINPLSNTTGYQAEFYAKDPAGATDYYRVKYYRNGKVQNKVNDLISLRNASFFNSSGSTDGLVFIRPVRQSINPDSLYALNDVVKVEVWSITADTYLFLQSVREQLTNAGLFATPSVNVPTNIVSTNGRTATGYFVASAIQSRTTQVTPESMRPAD